MMTRRFLLWAVLTAALALAGWATSPGDADAVTYVYDARNRLTTVTYAQCETLRYAYDPAGSITAAVYERAGLADAIRGMQILVGLTPALPADGCTDPSGDMKTGINDVIYILQTIAGMRQ